MNKRNSSAYNRDVSKRKAIRKRRIAEEIYPGEKNNPWYDNLHQYSKNKIHCSCPMCSAKTRNKGKRRYKMGGNYARNLNYKIVDLKKLIDMDEQELEFIDAPGKGEKRKNDCTFYQTVLEYLKNLIVWRYICQP